MPKQSNNYTLTHSAVGQAAITPNDSTDLPVAPCRGIYVGVTGDVTVDIGNDTNVTYKNAPQGQVLAVQATRVRATGTTATDLVALY
jgi:hypothetical protein